MASAPTILAFVIALSVAFLPASGAMRLLLAFPFIAPSAQAAPLTLLCSGTSTGTTQDIKDGVTTEDGVRIYGGETDPLKDRVRVSVTLDFDKRAVSGFWIDGNGHISIPIIAEDGYRVTFSGSKGGAVHQKMWGTVDRITGKIHAQETSLFRSGNLSHVVWDLRCTPAGT
jgi:hypothetical protein